nr:uncharacterized protein LOC113723098 [Coffea arabica]
MYEEIVYGPKDAVPLASNNHEAIVIEVITCNYKVKKVYIDNGSAIDVLYYKTFKELQLEDKQLIPVRTPLIGFAGPPVRPEGMITLTITIGESPKCRTISVNFAVVKEPSSYNMILGRPTLNALRAVCSTLHLSMKFPTPDGVAEVLGDPEVARACYIATLKGKEKLVAQTVLLELWEPIEKEERLETDESLVEVPICLERPDRVVRVGSGLNEPARRALESLLEEYEEIFAWSADDMPGVPPELAVHKLHVDPNARPVKQKKRNFAPERNEIVKEEVGKLLEAKIVKEIYYPTWLANPVLVKKEDRAWRMCVDFTDLNKACPKDCYPLPHIDQLVDSTIGCEIFCFLDAFKEYHQIALDEEDKEKTAFITEYGTYCYTTMPFGLKNAGATYQRLVNKLFKNQIGRNMEVYVDDMLVKRRTQEQFVNDLREIFDVLRSSRMRLNPKKCTFGVRSGKFLGYMISKDGVRANPDKVKAIMDMAPPRNIKEVQRLAGRMAALSRFLSKSAVRGSPSSGPCEEVPSLSGPRVPASIRRAKSPHRSVASLDLSRTRRDLIYLSSSRGGGNQCGASSGRRQDPEARILCQPSPAGREPRYASIERYVLALVHAARKLRSYFQAHPVVVMTDQPLKQILSKPDASGRMVRWAVELSEYDLSYQPRTAIKAQALADFIAEGVSFGPRESQVERTRDTAKAKQVGEAVEVAQTSKAQDAAEASQAGKAAQVEQATKTSEAKQTIDAVEAEGPAKVGQATRESQAKRIGDAAEAEQAKEAVEIEQATGKVDQTIPTWTLFVDGSSSQEGCGAGLLLTSPMGDELAYALRFDFRASNNESEYEALVAGMVIARKLGAESIEVYSDLQLIVNQVGGSYEVKEEPLRRYVAKVHELRAQFKLFTLEQVPRSQNKRADALSKLASTSVGTLNKEVLVEVVRNRAYDQVDAAVIQVVSSWMDPLVRYLANGELPSSRVEARRILLKSRGYEFSNGVLYKKSYLRPWLRCVTPGEGEYILRELHEGICGNYVGPRVLAKKGMLSGYYWPTIFLDSAELVARCKSCQLHAPIHHAPTQEMAPLQSPWPFFQWGIDLMGPFLRAPGGYEHVVVAVDYFTKWVEAELLTTISSRSVQKFLWRNIDYPAWFEDADGVRSSWVLDELPTILWAYRTTPRTATQETPFVLTYGAEAVIPAEIGVPSGRVQNFIAQDNEDELRLNLDLLEGRREEAAILLTLVARYYNARVRPLSFKPGDLVLRKNSVSRLQGTGKLDPNWEGPYVVKEADRAGYCKLTHLSGEEVPRTWHNSNLRIFR